MKRQTQKTFFCIISMMLVLMLCARCKVQVQAANSQKVVDDADLLSSEEESALQEKLYEIAESTQCDAVVVTVNAIEANSMQSYTDRYFYENGYGYRSERDGIILLINRNTRKYWLATRGDANRIFTDYGTEVITDLIVPFLSDGEYYDAFKKYASLVEEFIKEANENEPYDTDHTYSEPMAMWLRLLISLGAGVLVTAIVLGVLYSQLKSVGAQKRAQEYIRSGSFHVTRERDIFLYSQVTSRKIETKSSSGGGTRTHSCPGGGRSGGRGGSF